MNPPFDCGKTGYTTYREAQHIIKKMTWTARKKGRTARSQAIYKCGWCRAFHLTSHSYTIPGKDKNYESEAA